MKLFHQSFIQLFVRDRKTQLKRQLVQWTSVMLPACHPLFPWEALLSSHPPVGLILTDPDWAAYSYPLESADSSREMPAFPSGFVTFSLQRWKNLPIATFPRQERGWLQCRRISNMLREAETREKRAFTPLISVVLGPTVSCSYCVLAIQPSPGFGKLINCHICLSCLKWFSFTCEQYFLL